LRLVGRGGGISARQCINDQKGIQIENFFYSFSDYLYNKLYNKPGARFRREKQYGDQPMDQPTNGKTNGVSYRGACSHLKTGKDPFEHPTYSTEDDKAGKRTNG
jgi:hypothetical protein